MAQQYTDAKNTPITQTFLDPNTPYFAPATALYYASPVGMVTMFGGASAPANWLVCNGQAVNRGIYSTLFSIIGTTYGAGDGTTSFNVPNFSSKIPRGKGAGAFANLGATGGADTVTLVANNLPAHTHAVNDAGHVHTITDPGHFHTINGASTNGIATNGTLGPQLCYQTNVNSDNKTTGITINASSTGITVGNNTTTNTAVNVVDPYVVLNFIIKAK